MLLAAALWLWPSPCRADWFVIPAAGVSFGSSFTLLDLESAEGRSKFSLQGTVLWLGNGPFGLEGEVGYISGFFERGDQRLVTRSGVTTAMGSVVVTTPLAWTRNSLRPYAVAGFGLIHASSDDVLNVLPVSANLMGLRLGGGVTGFVTDTVGVRWDLSYLRTLKGQGNEEGVAFGSRSLKFWRASMGIVLRF